LLLPRQYKEREDEHQFTLFQQLNNEYGIHKAVHAWMILHDFTSEQLAAQAGFSPRHHLTFLNQRRTVSMIARSIQVSPDLNSVGAFLMLVSLSEIGSRGF
jgi:hypothetical protein